MTDSTFNPETWLQEHGDMMYRYALKHVRDQDLAQDLVQESFLAAWKGRENFDGRSTPRTWLIGILRHKILDSYRKNKRESPSADPELFEQKAESRHLEEGGHKFTPPPSWGKDPYTAIEDEGFMAVFEECLDNLPETMAQAFILRTMQDVDTDEACKILGVTPTNLYVLLYRARMKLKTCLEHKWFADA